jgi:hypothetical protein
MNTLICNLGTSDLDLEVDGSFYPTDNRNEPNEYIPPECSTWKDRREYIRNFFCAEIGYQPPDKGSFFKMLTKELKGIYAEQPDKFHSRIRCSRIQGVVDRAYREFGIKKAYFFITDQSSEMEPDGQADDTCYLFEILKLWFSRERPEIELVPIIVKVPLIDQDQLLDFYYQELNKLEDFDLLLVNIKGGTGLMQNALQFSAVTKKVLLVEPIRNIKDVMAGKASQVKFTSYFKYSVNQRNRLVKQLLDRWDFDGARVILESSLKQLREIEKYTQSGYRSDDLSQVLAAIKFCASLLSCDGKGAIKALEQYQSLKNLPGFQVVCSGKEDMLQDLYVQCKINYDQELNADFLWRMSLFYEMLLKKFADDWGAKVLRSSYQAPSKGCKRCVYFSNTSNFKNLFEQEFRNFFDKPETLYGESYRLERRVDLRIFLETVWKYDQQKTKLLLGFTPDWETMKTLFKQLDYWSEKRNQLIHEGNGMSKEGMKKTLETDREAEKKHTNSRLVALDACEPKDLLKTMANLYRTASQMKIAGLKGSESFKQDGYYVYEEVRAWILQKLEETNS